MNGHLIILERKSASSANSARKIILRRRFYKRFKQRMRCCNRTFVFRVILNTDIKRMIFQL